MIRKKFKNWLFHPVLFFQLLSSIIKNKFTRYYKRRAIEFFKSKGIYKYFVSGNKHEPWIDFIDLKGIYETVTSRKPKCVLEFGVGFSTICICLALKENEKNGFNGQLYTVDAEKFWLENTESKLPPDLKKYVTFHYSPCSVTIINNQLATRFENLPNISPNFIYIDGPRPSSVKGKIHGLGFHEENSNFKSGDAIYRIEEGNKWHRINRTEKGFYYLKEGNRWSRRIVCSDTLLYESSAPHDFFIRLDRVYCASNFLINNLKHKYIVKKDLAFSGTVTLERKYQPHP